MCIRKSAVAAGAFALLFQASAALACKGSTTILRDDFSEEDPAWDLQDESGQISGGSFKVKSESGRIAIKIYGGIVVPAGDACFDVIMPGGRPSNDVRGGLGLWLGRQWNFVYLATDGTAGVEGLQSGNWTAPVPNRKFDAIKTGPDAVNQVRVVWKAPPPSNATTPPDPTITVYINDKQFIRFKAPPNSSRQIAFYVASNGNPFIFKNLNVTE